MNPHLIQSYPLLPLFSKVSWSILFLLIEMQTVPRLVHITEQVTSFLTLSLFLVVMFSDLDSTDSHSSYPHAPFPDFFNGPAGSEHYPAWSPHRQIPMSSEEIEDIFLDLAQKFGFQRDSMRNMVLIYSLLFLSLLSFPSSTTFLCISSTLELLACLLTRPFSPSMQTTSVVQTQIIANGTLPLS